MASLGISNTLRLQPLSVLWAVWKRGIFVLSCLAIFGSAGAWIVHRLPNVYEASAVVLVDTQKIPEKFVSSTVQMNLQDSLSQIGQEVLSSGKLMGIIEELNLYAQDRKTKTPEEILARIRQDLPVTVERGITGTRSGAFRIAYQAPDPATAAAVANRVADLFVKQNFRTREERAMNTSAFMESALADAQKALDVQESALSKFKLQYAGELPEEQGALVGTLNRLQAELQGNDDQISRDEATKAIAENTQRFTQTTISSLERDLTRASAPATTPTATASHRTEVAPATPQSVPQQSLPSERLRQQLETLRLKYSDEYRDVKQLKKQLEIQLQREADEAAAAAVTQRQRELAEKARVAGNSPVPEAQPTTTTSPYVTQLTTELNREKQHLVEVQTQLAQISSDIRARQANRQHIMEQMSVYEKHLRALPIREAQMSALTRDYDNSRANYRSLLEKRQSAEISNEMERQQQSERFTIADPARPPSGPVKPRRTILYTLSMVLALGLGLILALAVEFKRNTLLGEWELPKDLPVLGRISQIDAIEMELAATGQS